MEAVAGRSRPLQEAMRHEAPVGRGVPGRDGHLGRGRVGAGAARTVAGHEAGVGLEPGPGMPPPGRNAGHGARPRAERGPAGEAARDHGRAARAARGDLREALRQPRRRCTSCSRAAARTRTRWASWCSRDRKLHEESRSLRDAEQKAIRAILTPEQQKKFDQVLEQRRERGPGRGPQDFQGRPPGGPGGPGGTGTRQPRPPIGTGNPGQLPMQP